jgi:amino acid adenylation domain-containing protein
LLASLARKAFMSAPTPDHWIAAVRLANATEADYPRQFCVHELLEAQARLQPDATAVEFNGRSLSYADLHARANQLARLLRNKGVGPDGLVGVCLERSLEMVVALLGVWKAGAAYVPLDPSYGIGRIQYVLEEARVKALITQESLGNSIPRTAADVICLDPSSSSLAAESDETVCSGAGPSNLAYVIYTSGSTGKPKGVQLEHRSVVNFLWSMRRQPGLGSADALLAVTTLSFDIAGLEIFLPLLVGARLVVASQEATFDGKLLKNLLRRSRATVLQATPTTWRLLFESGWPGDNNLKVLVGGEALSPELARKLAASCGSVWNMYGPTETTIWSSVYRVDGTEDRTVPIGKPIANTTFYVLDGNQQPVRSGHEGELYIGGEGLARGYLERQQLTAEKFLPDPFSERPKARMYRTGDLVRSRGDGNVEFLGRLDHQVKIRGFRIELGEVEAVLEQYPAIQHAVALARDGDSGDKYLAAYFIPRPGQKFTLSELRQHLRQQLPEYMIPSAFVTMREFPLTPNGKVDRKQLPKPAATDYQTGREYVAPRDAIEKKLVALWEDVLDVRPIGIKDGFFELGGRSLLAARLFIKIVHAFHKELPLTTLIHAPTVELLANELRPSSKKVEYPTLVPMRKVGSKPPFFCVHGGAGSTLFLHRLAGKMDSDQPFYGIEPEGLDGRRFQRTTIEQIAAHYLSEIRKIQPVGPYYIGGYCFGGIVAFEMAQQLRRQGDAAALVVLFTAPLRFHRLVAPAESEPPMAKPVSRRLATLMKSPARVLFRKSVRLVTKARLRLAPAAYEVWFRLGLRIPPSMRTLYVARTLLHAEQNYVPNPYRGTLVLFHGSDYESDPKLGWDGLAEHLEHRIVGNSTHDSRRDLMNEPLVAQTARELTNCINSACAEVAFPATKSA